jgi:CDP-diacylglycerol--serine O-phosphatidyltransferase
MEFTVGESLWPYLAFLLTIFSAIRLAKFNNDARQSDSFIGVPTPANAIFICSIALIIYSGSFYSDGPEKIVPVIGKIYQLHGDTIFFKIIFAPIFLSITVLIMSFLLVSELPLFALKFKHFKWKGNEVRFIFLALSFVLLVTLQFVGIPLIIILYIILSIVYNLINKSKNEVQS